MSERIDQFCDDLRNRLNGIDQHLSQMKDKLDAARKDNEAAIRDKIEEAQRGLEQKRKEHEEARADFKARFDAKKAEVKGKIDEWKRNRETERLVDRADDAEAYAVSAIQVARAAIFEAEVATLEAVGARLDAEHALAAQTKAA